MVARNLHLDVEFPPAPALIRAGVEGEDVARIGQADPQRARRGAGERARPLQTVAMHDQAPLAEAEACIEAPVVEQEQARLGTPIDLDLGLDPVAVVAGDAA